MHDPDFLRNMMLGISAEKMTAPVMSKEFQEKQNVVLGTPEGQALANRLMAYKMKVLEDIAFYSDTGRQVLNKYQADIENVHRQIEAEAVGKETAQRQDSKIEELKKQVEALQALLNKRGAVSNTESKA